MGQRTTHENSAVIQIADAVECIQDFDPRGDGLAHKSRELTLNLLRHTEAPFSRDQYAPGHVTGTALVLHPSDSKVLLMLHHRLRRWLLPGGHIEISAPSLADTAAREALEETRVQIDPSRQPVLVGIDVH